MLVKVNGLHFLNAPSFMDKLMMLIKPFLKKGLLDALHIHQIGSKTLEDFMPISGLPKESGGDFKSCEQIRGKLSFGFSIFFILLGLQPSLRVEIVTYQDFS